MVNIDHRFWGRLQEIDMCLFIGCSEIIFCDIFFSFMSSKEAHPYADPQRIFPGMVSKQRERRGMDFATKNRYNGTLIQIQKLKVFPNTIAFHIVATFRAQSDKAHTTKQRLSSPEKIGLAVKDITPRNIAKFDNISPEFLTNHGIYAKLWQAKFLILYIMHTSNIPDQINIQL